MRFVPRLSVRNRLIFAFLLVITLSWVLNFYTFRYIREQDRQRFRQEMAARGLTVPERRPRPVNVTGGRSDLPRHRDWRARYWSTIVPIQGTIAVILSLGAGAWLSRRFTKPLTQLENGAQAFHARNFEHRIPTRGNDEFARVASTMNEMAEHVQQQFQALEADAQRRQQLLADVAHELRSPVATMKTMAEALRDGVADQPERKERALSSMITASNRMQRLVNDLLELARLDLGQLPLYRQNVDLRQVAEESLCAFTDAAQDADIRFLPLRADGPALVHGDPLRLGQIIDNLLGNAVDHAGAGSEVRVEIRGGPEFRLTVTDTGRGIAADKLPYIFDPFYRGDTARTPGDLHSGLGLRISRALAEAHDGTLEIESEEGKGTRATLTLPPANASNSLTA